MGLSRGWDCISSEHTFWVARTSAHFTQGSCLKIKIPRTSLEVERLRFHAYDARGVDSILGHGTKIPHVMQCAPPPQKKEIQRFLGSCLEILIQECGLHLGIISKNFIIRLLYHLGYTCWTKNIWVSYNRDDSHNRKNLFLMVCVSPSVCQHCCRLWG